MVIINNYTLIIKINMAIGSGRTVDNAGYSYSVSYSFYKIIREIDLQPVSRNNLSSNANY